jgi:adenine-specific DNA-methyltransferase
MTTDNLDHIMQYIHKDKKRLYNPHIGLVTPTADGTDFKSKYVCDVHTDPQLEWSGKTENDILDVDTVPLYVHERIDPLTIIENVQKRQVILQPTLFHYFDLPENNPQKKQAIDFYKHDQGWTNRLIAGDSLLVMNSLLQKEGMGGKVQMIYVDPPYGIKYGSNFQPFVNKRDVKDRNDEDLTQEPEMLKAFRDTWELGIHSYLSYMRSRLTLAHELLTESGSVFVQISNENVHLIRSILDEIFGRSNFISQISFAKTSGFTSTFLATVDDYLLWYSKNKNQLKYRQLFLSKEKGRGIDTYRYIELTDGQRERLKQEELENPSKRPAGRLFRISSLSSQGESNSKQEFVFEGKKYLPAKGRHWNLTLDGLNNLAKKNRVIISGGEPQFVRYLDDFPMTKLTNTWDDTATGSFTDPKIYVVQTATKVVSRCMLMSTDPGDIVLDPTCGSGTTAYAAEQWGRRWITCDTSRVAIALAKQRLMTATYKYYELLDSNLGVGNGFKYESVLHASTASIAYDEPSPMEILFDKPIIDPEKIRITGPFTVEAVPSPVVKSIHSSRSSRPDSSIARSGESFRQLQWNDEILKTGVIGKNGQKIEFSRVEPFQGTYWLHAYAETKEKEPKRVAISFGPEYAPLGQTQVVQAIEEAQKLVPQPKIVLFASFQFDPVAAKDIDELNRFGITLLKAQMNSDLLTSDLKRKPSNQSFWLIGQPEIELKKNGDGTYIVEIYGFDYYNPNNGEIESGDTSKIAMWMLDTDYDDRSLYVQQFFFPRGEGSSSWKKLSKTLKGYIDEDLMDIYIGTTSLPFSSGKNKQVAVKIIDNRGIESFKILAIH